MSEHVKQLPEYNNLTAETADIFRSLEARLAASSKASADRIEKLEAALQAIIKRAEFRNSEYVTDVVCSIARDALKETK